MSGTWQESTSLCLLHQYEGGTKLTLSHDSNVGCSGHLQSVFTPLNFSHLPPLQNIVEGPDRWRRKLIIYCPLARIGLTLGAGGNIESFLPTLAQSNVNVSGLFNEHFPFGTYSSYGHRTVPQMVISSSSSCLLWIGSTRNQESWFFCGSANVVTEVRNTPRNILCFPLGVMVYLRQSVGDIKWSYWSPPPPCLLVEWPCDGCPLDRVVDLTGLLVDYVTQL